MCTLLWFSHLFSILPKWIIYVCCVKSLECLLQNCLHSENGLEISYARCRKKLALFLFIQWLWRINCTGPCVCINNGPISKPLFSGELVHRKCKKYKPRKRFKNWLKMILKTLRIHHKNLHSLSEHWKYIKI